MSRNRENIHKSNFIYALLKAYEKFSFNRYFKHIQVIGRENIPFGEQYIFAPNHQNALMDALAVLNNSGTDVVFVARADIFRKKRQAKFLRILKILPIYRIRDGASELSKNEEIFTSAQQILEDHVPFCVMPEGNHGEKRFLRPLVKGIFRIALRTQEVFGNRQGVKIVPVGLDYNHYQKFFQDLLVIYGQPIEVSEYFDSYCKNPPKGINNLKERLASELKKLIIHIENQELYDMYQDLREIYNNRMRRKMGILGRTHYDRFRADKQMIRILDERFKIDPDGLRELASDVRNYKSKLKELNLRNWIFERSGYTTRKLIYKRFGLLISAPVFLYGYINNWLPFTIPVKKTKNIKDAQFHSSFKFVLGMILFPVSYALQTLVVGIFTGPAWVVPAYLLSLTATGYFALFWSNWYKRWKAGLKYRRMKKRRDQEMIDLEKNYKSIIDQMDHIVNGYLNKMEPRNAKKHYV